MRWLILTSILILPLASFANDALEQKHPDKKICFLLVDIKSGGVMEKMGGDFCSERQPSCSTFKVPLALAAFDSGVLRDENTEFKWDGTSQVIKAWESDQTALTWMKNSVVWYSQRLTPLIGQARLEKDLADFGYGTHDLSGGLTTAWLTNTPWSKDNRKTTMFVSPEEQAKFWIRWWKGELPISRRADRLTKKITFLENSSNGFAMHGKTGSGFFPLPGGMGRQGWFVSHLEKGKGEFVAVLYFRDRRYLKQGGYAGMEAKNILKELLAEKGFW
jgi:beta-lactamase class D